MKDIGLRPAAQNLHSYQAVVLKPLLRRRCNYFCGLFHFFLGAFVHYFSAQSHMVRRHMRFAVNRPHAHVHGAYAVPLTYAPAWRPCVRMSRCQPYAPPPNATHAL